MRNNDGVITVFLSLILLIILALISTITEGARYISGQGMAKQITYISMDSCFSDYAREIFDEYGLLVMWKDSEQFQKSCEDFITKNTEINSSGVSSGLSKIISIKSERTHLSNIEYATQNGATNINNQINRIMKYKIPEDIVTSLIEKCMSIDESDSVTEVTEKVENCSESFSNIENTVLSIKYNADSVNDVSKKPKEYLEGLSHQIDNILNVDEEYDYDGTVRNYHLGQFKESFTEYVRTYRQVDTCFDDMIDQSTDYSNYVDNAKNKINELEVYIDSNDIDEDIKKSINDQIIFMKEKVSEKDYYYVENNLSNVNKSKEILENTNGNISDVIGLFDDNSISNMNFKDSNYKETLINWKNEINKAAIESEKYDVSGINVNMNIIEVEKNNGGILDFINSLKNDGVLGMVSDETSSKEINKEGLPSALITNTEGERIVSNEKSRIMTGQYIFDYLIKYGNKQDKSKKALDYEIEYILFGHSKDKENLQAVVDRLLLIREGFNYVYLLKDSAKYYEAETMATAIVGFTGMPLLVKVTQLLLIGAWAYAESIVDVKDLLEGYRVPIIKTNDDWNLGIDDILSVGTYNSGEKKERRMGLSYEDYIRAMLYVEDSELQIYRIMDVIQLNMQNKYNKEFKLNDCIVSGEITANYKMNKLFTSLFFVNSTLKKKYDGIEITVVADFSY